MNKKWIISTAIVVLVAWGVYSYLVLPKGVMREAYRPAQKNCFAEESPLPWKACVYSSPQGNSENLAYLLHGRNHDENEWNDDSYFTAQIQKVWATEKIKPPKIVVISFGPFWLLAPKSDAPKSGLLEVFTNIVIPEVEKRAGTPKKRILFGESMGGVNTLILSLRAGNLFSRALSLCPPIYKMSPFSSLEIINEFLVRTGADPRTIFGIKAIAHQYVTNEDEWNEISPIQLLAKADPAKTPPLYLSCGLSDRYGNYEAANYFADMAKAKGFKIEWHPLYGGHCVVDINSVANFLTTEN